MGRRPKVRANRRDLHLECRAYRHLKIQLHRRHFNPGVHDNRSCPQMKRADWQIYFAQDGKADYRGHGPGQHQKSRTRKGPAPHAANLCLQFLVVKPSEVESFWSGNRTSTTSGHASRGLSQSAQHHQAGIVLKMTVAVLRSALHQPVPQRCRSASGIFPCNPDQARLPERLIILITCFD